MSEQTTSPLEQETLNKFLIEIVKEHRASRRWKIAFRFIYIILFLVIVALFVSDGATKTASKPHTAVVNLRGVIMDDHRTSAKYISKGLEKAFKNQMSEAVILNINSGGGSPVQSSTIYDYIIELRKQYPEKKLYAVCSDACASGAYYIASAADEIYANKSSIVGSIGVIMNGFGFVDTMHKLGVERRLITSGTSKGFMDPFSPLKPANVEHTKAMMDSIHQQFINDVKKGRGARLRDDPTLFSGLVWTGEQAIHLGLIDGFGDVNSVARLIIKQDELIDYTYHGDFIQRLSQNVTNDTVLNVANFFGLEPQGMF